MAAESGDGHEGAGWGFGGRIAALQLRRARAVHRRNVAAAERAVQTLEASARRLGPGPSAAADNPFEASLARGWAGLRTVAQQALIATDTNMRAGYDCAERLLRAPDPGAFLAIQLGFLQEQSRRAAQQMIDLHRVASDATADVTARLAPKAPGPGPGAGGTHPGQAGTNRGTMTRSDVPFRHGRTRGLAQTRFHDIAYVEWGDASSPHVVVCVHGLTRQGRDFDGLAPALAALGYRVVCPDVVGRGRSGWLKDPELYGLPQYTADMALLIAHLGVERVDWVGTSMGGMIGMALAAAEATPVRRLVINDIGPFLPHAPVRAIGNNLLEAPGRYASLEEAEARLRRIHAPFGPLTDAQWRHLTEHSVVPDGSGGFRPHYDPGLGNAFRPGRVYDVSLWEMWDAITCPVLLLRGATSELLLAETAAEMTRRGPKARLVTIPGCGHAPALLDPDQIRIVTDWLGTAR